MLTYSPELGLIGSLSPPATATGGDVAPEQSESAVSAVSAVSLRSESEGSPRVPRVASKASGLEGLPNGATIRALLDRYLTVTWTLRGLPNGAAVRARVGCRRCCWGVFGALRRGETHLHSTHTPR